MAPESHDAAGDVVDLLTEAERLDRRRLQSLAMGWPSLAAALGRLVKDHGRAVPGSLRHAMSGNQGEPSKRVKCGHVRYGMTNGCAEMACWNYVNKNRAHH